MEKMIKVKLNLPKHDDLKVGETVVRDGIEVTRGNDFEFEGETIKVTFFK